MDCKKITKKKNSRNLEFFFNSEQGVLSHELNKITEDFKTYPYVLTDMITPDAKVENVELVVNFIKGIKF